MRGTDALLQAIWGNDDSARLASGYGEADGLLGGMRSVLLLLLLHRFNAVHSVSTVQPIPKPQQR